MFSRKMEAVRCIQQKAEAVNEEFEFNYTYAAENYQYYSSKFSSFEGNPAENLTEGMMEYAWKYLNFTLNPDTHFYNISVDTEHSSVHVPSNIFDGGEYDSIIYEIYGRQLSVAFELRLWPKERIECIFFLVLWLNR